MTIPRPPNPAWREAAQRGDKFYESDRPCKRGHLGRRYVAGDGCVVCIKAYSAEYQRTHPRPKKPPKPKPRAHPMRVAAKAAGQTTFNTGEPCKAGHTAPRYTDNNACTICACEARAARYRKRFAEVGVIKPPRRVARLHSSEQDNHVESLERTREVCLKTTSVDCPHNMLMMRAINHYITHLESIALDREAVQAERLAIGQLSRPLQNTSGYPKDNSNDPR